MSCNFVCIIGVQFTESTAQPRICHVVARSHRRCVLERVLSLIVYSCSVVRSVTHLVVCFIGYTVRNPFLLASQAQASSLHWEAAIEGMRLLASQAQLLYCSGTLGSCDLGII